MKRSKGFTLIELMVVIAVIGILASIALVSLTGVQRSARDAQRKSDLASYRTALEGSYAQGTSNQSYPGTAVNGTADNTISPASGTIFSTSSNPLVAAGFLPKPILDPQNNVSACKMSTSGASVACEYQYVTNSSNTTYAIWAYLENPTSNGGVFYIKSDSSTGYSTTDQTAP